MLVLRRGVECLVLRHQLAACGRLLVLQLHHRVQPVCIQRVGLMLMDLLDLDEVTAANVRSRTEGKTSMEAYCKALEDHPWVSAGNMVN